MNNSNLLGPWLRRFLVEHLTSERNLARNTQQSYRDTLRLLLPYAAKINKQTVDRLLVEEVSADIVRSFLQGLEDQRKCSVSTRNQRLAAIHSLARFIGTNSPEHVSWCGEIRAIPAKKTSRPLIAYLEKEEMDALLAAPDRTTAQGRRDHAVLLFLYNTGVRADELAHVRIVDLAITQAPTRCASSVLIHGKGGKLRRCPLWDRTVDVLLPLLDGRESAEHAFLNRHGRPLTRFGVHDIVERHAAKAAISTPSIATKRVSPHTIRHTTATHLLRAGVDINTIRAWLGHVSLTTTNIYAEVDLEMKAKALANCELEDSHSQKPWRANTDLMTFLQNL